MFQGVIAGYTCIYLQYTCIYGIYMHIHALTWAGYIYMHICANTCIHSYTCIYMHIHTYMFKYMHIHAYTCIYAQIYTQDAPSNRGLEVFWSGGCRHSMAAGCNPVFQISCDRPWDSTSSVMARGASLRIQEGAAEAQEACLAGWYQK